MYLHTLKFLLPIAFFCTFSPTTAQMNRDTTALPTTVQTSLGEIACYIHEVAGTVPVLFLHGVYFDRHLWDYQVDRLQDRTTIAVDMPLHGRSKAISKSDWNMADCAQMVVEILDVLEIERCYAIGHSWGSMTLLRAAHQHPQRFLGLGLCNMPLEPGKTGTQLQFGFQHSMLPFRKFYVQQVAKAMFASGSRAQHPELLSYLSASMDQLSAKDIRKTDQAVITKVESGWPYLQGLQVPALALKGKEDYVPLPGSLETVIVEGKHSSPLEQPEAVLALVRRLIGG